MACEVELGATRFGSLAKKVKMTEEKLNCSKITRCGLKLDTEAITELVDHYGWEILDAAMLP